MDTRFPGIQNKLNVNRLNRPQHVRPLEQYDRLYRDLNHRHFYEEKQQHGLEKEENDRNRSTKDAEKKEVKETVTISLERYEQLRNSQQRLEELEKRLRDMVDYQLISVKAERATYHVNVDQEMLKRWLSEMIQHKNSEIRSMSWKVKGDHGR